jgi:glycosyltransferase involved in cell wall biosynthesis
MSKKSNVFVSVIFVADEHAEDVAKRTRLISKELISRYSNYEILIVDNGLGRKEFEALKSLLPKIACIRVVRLSKNYDTDTAIFAGVEASIGDFVCILYSHDPVELIPEFIKKAHDVDIVFGVATNLKRRNYLEEWGAKIFYWYSKRYMEIDIPKGATYYICMNRSAANALTRSGRFMRHIRHMANQVGFESAVLEYKLPIGKTQYTTVRSTTLISRFIDLVSNYSSHPLRVLSYFGIIGGLLNLAYAVYVLVINLSTNDIAKGWTTLSLQASIMFFILFMILALLAEYVGKILNEVQQEPPYHIMQELSSTVSIADETRRNVTYND